MTEAEKTRVYQTLRALEDGLIRPSPIAVGALSQAGSQVYFMITEGRECDPKVDGVSRL